MINFLKVARMKKEVNEIFNNKKDHLRGDNDGPEMIMNLSIKKLREDAKAPFYAHATDAGLDLCYASDGDVIMEAGAQGMFDTGLAFAIPVGYVGLIWDKSGLASKHGLKVMGGVIDSGYRGEIKVMLLNTSKERISIKSGQKIAQILIQQVENTLVTVTDDLPSPEDQRGDAGFGSTGE